MAEIYSLVYQPEPSVDEPPFRFNRVRVDQVNLIANHGIDGDRKAGHHPERQLNIMSYDTLQDLKDMGFAVEPGEMGEQVIVSGMNVQQLEPGTRLQLGEGVIEVTKLRTGCAWLEKVQGHAIETIQGRVGVMATVITGGIVKEGDAVKVVEMSES